MINLEKIYSYTEDIIKADSNLGINQFTYGDIYEKMNQSECKYAALNMSLIDVNQSGNTVTYKFNIFYVDKLLEDRSNEAAILDNSYQVIMRLLNTFSNGCDELKGEAVNIVVGSQYTPFTENFADLCAGCYVEVTYQILNYVGQCSEINVPVYPNIIISRLDVELTEDGLYEYVAEENTAWDNIKINVTAGATLVDEKIKEHNESLTAHPDIRTIIEDVNLDLQSQIDGLESRSDVTDIVGSYSQLISYPTGELVERDVILVLIDETRNDATSYYRWLNRVWVFVGSISSSYTKAESDSKYATNERVNSIESSLGGTDDRVEVLESDIVILEEGIETANSNINQLGNRIVIAEGNINTIETFVDKENPLMTENKTITSAINENFEKIIELEGKIGDGKISLGRTIKTVDIIIY